MTSAETPSAAASAPLRTLRKRQFSGFLARASGCVVATILVVGVADVGAVDLQRECRYLVDHLAIDQKLHAKLKHDQVRVRCGKRTVVGKHILRDVTLYRMPAHESVVRVDRYTGRVLTLSVDRLPIPELDAPKDGWPSLAKLAVVARKQGQIPADAKLLAARYVRNEEDGLSTGDHPYAEFGFEHHVEGAQVIGDRIIARVDLRLSSLVWLDARRWTSVKSPDSRTTEGRALRTAAKALQRLDPAQVPCCQSPQSGEGAENAIGMALSKKASKAAKKAGKRKRKRRAKRRRRGHSGPIIACEPRLKRRVYLHDRKGKLVEAYEMTCIPTCNRAGVIRQCTKRQAATVFVDTRKGKLLGMKGQIAPERYRWQPPPRSKRVPLNEDKLSRQATKLLRDTIHRVEPHAQLKSPRCPPTEDDPHLLRRCANLMLPAMRYRARQTETQLVWEMPKNQPAAK